MRDWKFSLKFSVEIYILLVEVVVVDIVVVVIVVVEVTDISRIPTVNNRIYMKAYVEYYKLIYLTMIQNVMIATKAIVPITALIKRLTKHGFDLDLSDDFDFFNILSSSWSHTDLLGATDMNVLKVYDVIFYSLIESTNPSFMIH